MVLTAFERRRHKRLAAERRALSQTEFIYQMSAEGVLAETAKFVWREVVSYYFEPLKPDPGDHWETTMRIDPEDLEDITAKFWKQQGWIEPDRANPVVLPCDPTLLQYAMWLDEQRQRQQ